MCGHDRPITCQGSLDAQWSPAINDSTTQVDPGNSQFVNPLDQEFVDTAQLTQLLELQQFILGSIATGERFELIIEQLCRLMESMVPDANASVMLLKQENDELTLQAGPFFLTEILPYFEALLPSK